MVGSMSWIGAMPYRVPIREEEEVADKVAELLLSPFKGMMRSVVSQSRLERLTIEEDKMGDDSDEEHIPIRAAEEVVVVAVIDY